PAAGPVPGGAMPVLRPPAQLSSRRGRGLAVDPRALHRRGMGADHGSHHHRRHSVRRVYRHRVRGCGLRVRTGRDHVRVPRLPLERLAQTAFGRGAHLRHHHDHDGHRIGLWLHDGAGTGAAADRRPVPRVFQQRHRVPDPGQHRLAGAGHLHGTDAHAADLRAGVYAHHHGAGYRPRAFRRHHGVEPGHRAGDATCWGHAVCGHCGGTRHHGTDHAHDMAVLRGHADMSVTGDVCPCPELVAAGAGGRTLKPRATRAAPPRLPHRAGLQFAPTTATGVAMLTFKQIEALYWVVQLGGFANAAERLNTTQSAITKRIQELETSFNIQIFDRSGQKATLTRTGEDLLELAADLLARRDQMLLKMKGFKPFTGSLRLGITEITAMTWLPQLMHALRAAFPELAVQLKIGMAWNLQQNLLSGQLDMAILHWEIRNPHLESEPLA